MILAGHQFVAEWADGEDDELAGGNIDIDVGQLAALHVLAQDPRFGFAPTLRGHPIVFRRNLIFAHRLAEEHLHEVLVPLHHALRGERDRHQRFGRRAANLVDAQLLEVVQGGGDAALLEECLEELAFGGEVVVDRGVGDTSAVGDVADAGAGEPLLREEA